MNKKWILGGSLLLVLFASVWVLAARTRTVTPISAELRVPVRTGPVVVRELALPIRTSGVLAPATEMRLSFKTGGILATVRANEGEHVLAGQILAALDTTELSAAARAADAGLEKAHRDLDRVTRLFADSAATREQLENARTAVTAANSNHRAAAFQVSRAVLRAPVAGRILGRPASQGEVVSPGQPIYHFGSDAADWVLRVQLSDRDIVRVSIGDSASVELSAYPGSSLVGRVTEVGRRALPSTGTFQVEIAVTATTAEVAAGFFGRASIFPAVRTQAMLIPVSALVSAAGLQGVVYAINDPVQRARRRHVRLGRVVDDSVVVHDGVLPGERIITDGAAWVSDGARVDPNPEARER